MSKKVYHIIDVTIHDMEAMRPYSENVLSTIGQYGGKRIVAGGKREATDGTQPEGVVVMLEFPSWEAAHAWHNSPEYQAIIGLRHQHCTSNFGFFIEGE